MTLIQSIPVDLGERSYEIVLGDGILASGLAGERIAHVAGRGKVALVTHPHLDANYAAPLAESLRNQGLAATVIHVPAGERSKTLAAVERLYRAFMEAGLDRRSLVVTVGGGVLSDLGGFAAATYLRGVRFAAVPTTLLAQVDASVGGKTGVDLPYGKNLVGAFHQPSVVIIDTATLSTLPARELRSGLAEVIKYGIIFDKRFFTEIREAAERCLKRDRLTLERAIQRSCEIKAAVVTQDETEQGLRAILNFGHTVGHALEAITAYRRYKHGEAIAIGMVTEALIGEELGITPPDVTRSICEAISALQLPIEFPADVEAEAVVAAAKRDKKTIGGHMHVVLARSIGEVCVSGDVTPEIVHSAIRRHKEGLRATR
jgi:3-dehydroquinate synthase